VLELLICCTDDCNIASKATADMESISKLSFGINETLRIIVPGYYLLAALSLYLHVICPKLLAESFPGSFVAIVAGLILGLILYSFNHPNRRDAYKRGLPSAELMKRSKTLKGATALDKNQAKQLYFYILNNFMPQTFHEVVMVKGALYYCITYVREISASLALLGLLTAAVAYIHHCFHGVWAWSWCGFDFFVNGWRICGMLLYIVVQFVTYVCLWYHSPNEENRADAMLHGIYDDQIKWMEMNSPLVNDLITFQKDRRVDAYFKDASAGSPGSPGATP
jgi:hypothetical protein